ncbi:MAG: hypothetical protein HN368_10250 [Spirochaetales bacterium]|jgi:hypothetical protein|nr:hypothetical protein [Spirochaetales bacterium]
MATKKDVLSLVRIFSLRKKSQVLAYQELVAFSQKYAEQKKADIPSLAALTSDTEIQLSSHLDDLAEEKKCALVYDQGRISSVVYPEFFPELVKKKYKEIAEDPEIPFPNENTFQIKIPSDNVDSVDIKADFVQVLGNAKEGGSRLLRLSFPQGINNILTPSDIIGNRLMELCVEKVRLYLNTQRNAFYMLSKLRGVFKSKEQVLKDMINSIITQRTQALETIHNPTEFSFSFWTHLANAIIREYREKTNKLEKEHSHCQAAYLLGFYNVYYKGLIQKEKDIEATLKILDQRMRQTPYYFTVSDISSFKDKQGLLLTRKYSREQMHKYIEEKTKPIEGASIPEIFRLKSADRKEYFVAKEVILPLTVKKLQDASKEYRGVFLEEFKSNIENIKKTDEMKSDDAFNARLEKKVRSDDPLLSGLLSYEMLYLTLQESKPRYDVNQEISRILDESRAKLLPIDEILRLNRRELFSQAKMSLPIWKTMPVVNRIFGFLKRFLTGAQMRQPKSQSKKKKKIDFPVSASGVKLLGAQPPPSRKSFKESEAVIPSSPGSPAKSARAQAQALQNAMASLKLQFIGNTSIEDGMGALVEKWNPLFDPQAKANLVEDVNSLVRDFLRKLKRGFLFKPPDADRIRNMAESLAENHAFDQIKKRDALKRYIELYMISVLGARKKG